MAADLLTQRPRISVDDVDVVAIDYSAYLDSSEILTGTPTVVSLGKVIGYDADRRPQYQSNTDLTIANIGLNAGSITVLRKTVVANKAVQFKVSGQQAGVTYGVKVTASTNSNPARTKVVEALLITNK